MLRWLGKGLGKWVPWRLWKWEGLGLWRWEGRLWIRTLRILRLGNRRLAVLLACCAPRVMRHLRKRLGAKLCKHPIIIGL